MFALDQSGTQLHALTAAAVSLLNVLPAISFRADLDQGDRPRGLI